MMTSRKIGNFKWRKKMLGHEVRIGYAKSRSNECYSGKWIYQ